MQPKESIEKIIRYNYKHDRLFGRGEDYGNTVIKSAVEEFEKHGYIVISRHESLNGEARFIALCSKCGYFFERRGENRNLPNTGNIDICAACK